MHIGTPPISFNTHSVLDTGIEYQSHPRSSQGQSFLKVKVIQGHFKVKFIQGQNHTRSLQGQVKSKSNKSTKVEQIDQGRTNRPMSFKVISKSRLDKIISKSISRLDKVVSRSRSQKQSWGSYKNGVCTLLNKYALLCCFWLSADV